MYITTFYSFKGGVGRTMSLVNIGLELVKSGRRVLMVDFDLEAPGIETFNLPKPKDGSYGLVDYVTHYRETGKSPDVRDYLYPSQSQGKSNGKLWIMPSGMHDENYAKRLSQIKWDDIYNKEDGYLMIEDMKAQWKEFLEPDYVLIDSRTGHTDVGGICTRQLPDAVVVLFLPNEQNLLGLEKVVPTIRAESATRKRKPIQIHFVSSNVPDLDDEKQILEKRIASFKQNLEYGRLACTIHHYNHLSLLDQEVFTNTHPRSQLAKEYRELYYEIVKHNPEDRDGVLSFLKDIIRSPRHVLNGLSATELENRLDKICLEHRSDGEVLSKVAMFRYRSGKERDAFELLNQSISIGYESPELFLMRASLGCTVGNEEGVLDDLKKVLSSEDAEYFEVNRAIELLKRVSPAEAMIIPGSLAFRQLPPDSRYKIANDLCDDEKFLPVAKIIIENGMNDKDVDKDLLDSYKAQLSLIEISLGEYNSAMNLIGDSRSAVLNQGIRDVFNYAMAEWAEKGKPSKDLFEKVVELSSEDEAKVSPNYSQCMALSYWATGDIDTANAMTERSEQQIISRPKMEFSAWRYLKVSQDEFLKDLEALRSMINGTKISPLFMQKGKSLLEGDSRD